MIPYPDDDRLVTVFTMHEVDKGIRIASFFPRGTSDVNRCITRLQSHILGPFHQHTEKQDRGESTWLCQSSKLKESLPCRF